jgi:predicted permease
VLAALVAVSALTVFLFGLVPAFYASKTDVTRVLKDSGAAGSSRRGAQRWSTLFLAAEFGLAVVLLAQITVNIRSDEPGLPSDDVLDTTQVLTAVVTLPPEMYRSPEQRTEFHRRLQERLLANPALSAVSLTSVLPLQGGPETRMDVDGQPQAGGQPAPPVRTVLIGPRFFETLGLTLKQGRDFVEEDGSPGRAYALVNEQLAQQFFMGQNAIGQRISIAAPGGPGTSRDWLTIVGIVPDIRHRASADPTPIVYLPQRTDAPSTITLLVRARGDSGDLVPYLRREVQALDPNLPLYRLRTLAQAARDAQWNGRLASTLIRVLTLIAVGLATVGLYAVAAYSVSQRAHEIGVRVALGARPRQVAAVVARRIAKQLVVGFTVGVGCTLLWEWAFPAGNPSIRATDPASLAMVAAVLVLVATIASVMPIRRALRLDPVAALNAG